MFGRKTSRQTAAIRTLISADTRVQGDVQFAGGFLIDGHVKGNVTASGEGAMLSISERGCVEGTVDVPKVYLNGTIEGDLRATDRVELGPKARVIGNVRYKLIEMAVGAEVNGKLIHEGEAAEPETRPAHTSTAGSAASADAGPAEAASSAARTANAVGE